MLMLHISTKVDQPTTGAAPVGRSAAAGPLPALPLTPFRPHRPAAAAAAHQPAHHPPALAASCAICARRVSAWGPPSAV